ncbi:MAG: aluminum induced protein-domain-containing protein [Monoraphidium minutum]|nr:MAG: aluminum induced protein-domain-containing protein [Monoraphidium minutum]
MVYLHMLAVFDRETAKAPSGLTTWNTDTSHRAHSPKEDERVEESCRHQLERAYSASKPASRKLELLGHGNGFTFEASPYCSYANEGGVHILFAGEVGAWPGVNAVNAAHDAFMRGVPPPEANDAHWLLDFYRSFFTGGAVEEDADKRALESLAQVQGSFAFVIFDELQHRVFAARDGEGAQPLYWGATGEGQLLIGSHLDDMEECNPTATHFPAGTLFASERHTVAFSPGDRGWVISEGDWPGRLFSFLRDSDGTHWRGVKAIPRVTSKGYLCGAVYKVASAQQLPPDGAPGDEEAARAERKRRADGATRVHVL